MFKKLLQIGLDFLFPKNCLICGEGEEFLCSKCFRNLKFIDPKCLGCGGFSKLGEFCDKCKDNFHLKGVLVAGDFEDENLAKLIKFYKYNFISDLSKNLAKFMINFLRNNISLNPILINNISWQNNLSLTLSSINSSKFLIIPVPLSKKRLKWRGFNQSELLAKILSEEMGLKISLNLKRPVHKKAQAKLGQKERQENLVGCYKWSGESFVGENIIIVDDVCTTSSTLNEIAKELKKHQAGDVWGLVLAKG